MTHSDEWSVFGLPTSSISPQIKSPIESTARSQHEKKRRRKTSSKFIATSEIGGTNPILTRLVASLAIVSNPGTQETTVRESDYLPVPFTLSVGGLNRNQDDEKVETICGPLIVGRLTRGANGYDFGLQIVGETLDGKIVELSIPATRLHGDPAELARTLADRGIRVVPGKEKHLAAYLDAARTIAANRPWLTAQSRLGWSDGNIAAYVLPERVLGQAHSVFQPERANRMSDACVICGTLEDWKRRVAEPASLDDVAIFVLCSSFAAALLRPTGSDSFGFHLCGLTSRGKTTLLQLAASVWGRGGDPGSDSRAFCRRWNATGNALESLAEEHSDMPLPLDELGTFRNAADLGRAVYNLAGGRGTERLKSDGQRRTVREWRTLILSSGEISLVELMRQNGQHQKGGQALRILDIALPACGIFASQPNPGDVVRELKRSVEECYGTAGRTFVAWLIDRFGTHNATHEAIRLMRQRYTRELADERPEITRAADRFALVRIAGNMAREAGILDYSDQKIQAAVYTAWRLWQTTMPDVDDGKRAVRGIAEFIAAHPGQFPLDTETERLPQTVAGYYKSKHADGALYLFTDDGFSAAIGDIAKPAALAALEASGLLFKNDTARKKSKHYVAALGSARAAFYAIRARILDFDNLTQT